MSDKDSRATVHEIITPSRHTPPYPSPTRTYLGCFPLPFKPFLSSSGCFGKDFRLENILFDDHRVWSSDIQPPVMVVFHSEQEVTLTEVCIKIPRRDFTCPARSFQLHAYDRYIGRDQLTETPLVRLEGIVPRPAGFIKHVFSRPVHGVKSIMLEILDVHNDMQNVNVDLQFVGFGGYTGCHAFPFAKFI